MRIYRVAYYEPHMGCRLTWCASKRAAESEAADQRRELGPDAAPSVQPFDIPATKRGLLNWLNIHVTSDNG